MKSQNEQRRQKNWQNRPQRVCSCVHIHTFLKQGTGVELLKQGQEVLQQSASATAARGSFRHIQHHI